MKRSLVVALAGTALVLSGCGGSSSGGGNSSTASSSSGGSGSSSAGSGSSTAAAAPTSVSTDKPQRDANADLVIWADATAAPVVQKLADKFAAKNGIKVAVQIANDVRGQYETAFKAGQAPDVIVGAHDWLGELVANGAVAPLQVPASVESGFTKNAVAATKFNNQTYAVPYGVENLALVRNTALAPTAPKTMDDLIKAGTACVSSKKCTNILSNQVGKQGNAYNAYPFLSAFGGGIFGTKANGDYDPNNLIVDSPNTLKGAALLAQLGKQKVLSTNIDDTNADNLFATGKTPFEITGPWSLPAFQKAGVKYAVDPLPTVAGGGQMVPFLGVQMFYVSAKAKNATIAQQFVTNYVTTKDAQVQLFQVGKRPPALTAAYDEVAKTDPDVAAWNTAGKNGKLMPNIPAMNSVWGPLGQAEADVVSGKAQPDARFKKAATEISAAIKSGK
ncbi:maltose ABC transporter substrate-binding protein [Calidifontibacter sp. DB0510]|uniref:Maltose ABC transporter substrate-binding protein n=1 Tax=Metallococcus carri TaxID=1656884 RepID=A0A967B1G7_9MICO|nr:maltose ABC transporter substrate-binding protein [Metallococcus carri]NHN55540.1 maltose ABC transporter substrate-binding protein [Metallococcus carri]NOP38276.1 maltose ABC transporter substrate-binding protein [Calidifontibacter sp. DB2511S]